MNYEKAYKEALERARKSHDKSNGFIQKEWIETIFPELKESEEERDKRMWKLIKKYAHSNISITVLDADHIIRDQLESWLEKQGEPVEAKAKKFLIDKGYPIDANGTFPTYEEMYNIIGDELKKHHEWVDLGLPSGTTWATCNIGATKPEEYGDYFAWEETSSKEIYAWDTYKHANGQYNQLTKYCDSEKHGKNGFADNKHTLDSEDDAAYVNWGSKWCMPTAAQQEELLNECYCVWTDNYNGSGVKGWIIYKTKSASDKGVKIGEGETASTSYIYTLHDTHIFLPNTGYRCDGDPFKSRSYGNYLSSTLDKYNPCNAHKIFLYPYDVYCTECGFRPTGYTIRPVLNQES